VEGSEFGDTPLKDKALRSRSEVEKSQGEIVDG